MDLIGRTTIHPSIFYTGKIAGYMTWIALLLSFFGICPFKSQYAKIDGLLFYLLLTVSLFFIVVSLINLGKSTRLGLPADSTDFKSDGLYKISRNPMYVGFDLLTVTAILHCPNTWIILSGIYSIVVYHFIILGEEAFLEKRFDNQYPDYKKRVRRYL